MRVARIYDDPPGQRILVDRLWPRGLTKERAGLTRWAKELAPSDALRKAYHAGMAWEAFEAAYREELEEADLSGLDHEGVVLVTSAKASPCHADILVALVMERRALSAPRGSRHG